jgi:acyl-CoA thioester hydrolase
MPRTSGPPNAPEFVLELTVTPEDVDNLGHVNNIVYVRWLQDVAVAHAQAVGLNHARLIALGSIFVVRKHEIEYLRPGFLGQRVRLRTHVASWKGATCERVTRIERIQDGTHVALAKAKTTWAYVTIDGGKPTRIPAEVASAFMHPVPPEQA